MGAQNRRPVATEARLDVKCMTCEIARYAGSQLIHRATNRGCTWIHPSQTGVDLVSPVRNRGIPCRICLIKIDAFAIPYVPPVKRAPDRSIRDK